MGIHLGPFDPERPFVCATHFLAAGRPWLRGEVFDKSVVNPRVLQRLYETRRIRYADEAELAAMAEAPPPEGSKAARKAEKRARAEQAAQHPLDHDDDGKKGGSLPEDDSEEARAKRLAHKFNKAELFQKASGLAGVTKDQTKDVIALALIRAGREPA